MLYSRMAYLAWLKTLEEWVNAVIENERNPYDKQWEEIRENTWNELVELKKIIEKEKNKG